MKTYRITVAGPDDTKQTIDVKADFYAIEPRGVSLYIKEREHLLYAILVIPREKEWTIEELETEDEAKR